MANPASEMLGEIVEHLKQRHELLPTQYKKAIKFGGGAALLLLIFYFVMPESSREVRKPKPTVKNVFSGSDTRIMGVDALVTEVQNTRDELAANGRLVESMRGELNKAKQEVEKARQIQATAMTQMKKTGELEDRLAALTASEQERKDAYETDIARVTVAAKKTVTDTVKDLRAKESEIEKRVNEVEALAKEKQGQQLDSQSKTIESQGIELETLKRKLDKIVAGDVIVRTTTVESPPDKSIDTGTSFTPPDMVNDDNLNEAADVSIEDPRKMGPVEVKDGIATHPGFLDETKPIANFDDPETDRRGETRVADPGAENSELDGIDDNPKMRAFLEAVRTTREESLARQKDLLNDRRPPASSGAQVAQNPPGAAPFPGASRTTPGQFPAGIPQQQTSQRPQGQQGAPTQLSQVKPRGTIKTYGAGGEITEADELASLEGELDQVNEDPAAEETTAEPETKEVEKAHLPSGSILSGVLITGMDAFTDLGSSRDPQPTLIRVTSKGILPNFFSNDYRECFLLAEGHGQLSSERVAIRVHTMSCVRNNGEAFEVGIQAFASGEDGKEGIRGRVVSRNGQLLARSLQAGFMQGVSEAFGGVTVGGVNTSPENGDARVVESLLNRENITNAGLSGTGKALDRIAEYYLKLAEDIFPVIEIDAGREIDFIVTKGSSLPILDADADDT